MVMRTGFTLAELLIALAILGVIATFSIPKVLNAQQNTAHNAIAKETLGSLSAAFEELRRTNGISAATTAGNLSQYLNYVSVDTSSEIDDYYGMGTMTCSSSEPCLRLHNGAVLMIETACSLTDTTSKHALWFWLDPDGVPNSDSEGPGKSLKVYLYTTGRIATEGTMEDDTYGCGSGPWTAEADRDPPWFSWD